MEQSSRGVMLTIDSKGRVEHRILGSLNEAEFMGLGSYLDSLLTKEGFMTLVRGQNALVKSIGDMTETLGKVLEPCQEESSSESCPSLPSGQSTESSPEQSEE